MNEIQVKISDDVLKGQYANMLQVSHTPEEFLLDFMNIFNGAGIVTSRVIISPGHLKRILEALKTNFELYESKFGSIKASGEPEGKIGFKMD